MSADHAGTSTNTTSKQKDHNTISAAPVALLVSLSTIANATAMYSTTSLATI